MDTIKEQGTSEKCASLAHYDAAIDLAGALRQYRYRLTNELDLHLGIAKALDEHGVSYRREVAASARDRFDFITAQGIVIEAKVSGSYAEAVQQCGRYAEHEDVHAVVLCATRFWAAAAPAVVVVNGKPIVSVRLQRAGL